MPTSAFPDNVDVKGLFPDELAAVLAALDAPAYRAKQLFAGMHRRLATSFAALSELPAALREALAARCRLTALETRRRVEAPDGTAKYLFGLADGRAVESVRIPEADRVTVCLSSMVGCPFGCGFCATGQAGFARGLSAAEMVDQVYRIQADLPAGRHVTNVVYMGMGEPLANYDAVVRSIRLLNHPLGLHLGQRRITLSTVGIVPGIERLADEGLQVGLAISLHAPTQAARARLVPIAKKYPLDALMAAARRFVRRTGRKVTFEYTVAPGRNDSDADADALAALVRGLRTLVNVIPLNPTPGFTTAPGADLRAAADRFVRALRARGVEAALRQSRGAEVGGACGQLAGEA
ncbi:MAG TPA: 23S rRNA (adenine(2503)-C(2))-methyltransferase RlmN [Armatimonadota bacterium]|nr:23S rRNA (adenine(2503)-C(2))-methyltransferase RlmN [Armatimonadota bacterium]HOS42967.1 23S rRNA (adenine(2503)-C(2))-methyltransferase RlmN [Armatimonadota bacterium]